MQVANTRENSVEGMFCYVTFGLLQVEMEGSFKKSYISYVHMHIHKHDTFGFNVKKIKQFI